MRRICEHCGKPITFGCMTNDYGDFYIHEECFEEWMKEKKNGDPWGCPNEEEIYYTEYTKEDLEDEE